MAAKKKTAYEICIAELKKNPNVEFTKVRDKAERQGEKLFPIVYGRAKAALGLVPVRKRGEAKAEREAKAANKVARKKMGKRAGGSVQRTRSAPPSRGVAVSDILGSVRDLEQDRDMAREALESAREILEAALR